MSVANVKVGQVLFLATCPDHKVWNTDEAMIQPVTVDSVTGDSYTIDGSKHVFKNNSETTEFGPFKNVRIFEERPCSPKMKKLGEVASFREKLNGAVSSMEGNVLWTSAKFLASTGLAYFANRISFAPYWDKADKNILENLEFSSLEKVINSDQGVILASDIVRYKELLLTHEKGPLEESAWGIVASDASVIVDSTDLVLDGMGIAISDLTSGYVDAIGEGINFATSFVQETVELGLSSGQGFIGSLDTGSLIYGVATIAVPLVMLVKAACEVNMDILKNEGLTQKGAPTDYGAFKEEGSPLALREALNMKAIDKLDDFTVIGLGETDNINLDKLREMMKDHVAQLATKENGPSWAVS